MKCLQLKYYEYDILLNQFYFIVSKTTNLREQLKMDGCQ